MSIDVPARLVNGVWIADTALDEGDIAWIVPGGIKDATGATNGSIIRLSS
jgi:hypothetical protein